VAATVVGMLGRGADADDVGQETFVRFFRALEGYRGDASLKTYLTRIAMNQSLRALKKRQRWRLRFFSSDEGESDVLARIPDSKDELGERERREFVQSALQTLSPGHRSVVILRVLEGYDTRETADLLGIPPGTVMSRLARALEKLEDVLRPML
jgi:RNA polymerase sigma-70 factor (ECF subfamily)